MRDNDWRGNGWRAIAIGSIVFAILLLTHLVLVRKDWQALAEKVADIEISQTNIEQNLMALNRRVGNSVDLLANLINKIGEEHGQESNTQQNEIYVVPILTGTVTYSDDNAPLKSGVVRCLVNGVSYSGEIKEDGTYKILKPYGDSETGIPAGLCQVTIFASTLLEANPDGSVPYENLIDPKYTDNETSGITVTIPHEGPFDIKVDRYRK